MPTEYSKKTLVQKLGIGQGYEVAILNPPRNYIKKVGKLPDGVIVTQELKGQLDFILIFERGKASLEREFPKLKERLKQDGMIWVSWPKASANLQTDLSESRVRDTGLRNGMVDVKICAIDKEWSGLKFVRRLKDRV